MSAVRRILTLSLLLGYLLWRVLRYVCLTRVLARLTIVVVMYGAMQRCLSGKRISGGVLLTCSDGRCLRSGWWWECQDVEYVTLYDGLNKHQNTTYTTHVYNALVIDVVLRNTQSVSSPQASDDYCSASFAWETAQHRSTVAPKFS